MNALLVEQRCIIFNATLNFTVLSGADIQGDVCFCCRQADLRKVAFHAWHHRGNRFLGLEDQHRLKHGRVGE